MKHPRYRNFFTAERNDVFAGLPQLRRLSGPRYTSPTAKISTAAVLPLNGTGPSASARHPVAERCVSPRRSGSAGPATLVCASSRAARLTVSPMQV